MGMIKMKWKKDRYRFTAFCLCMAMLYTSCGRFSDTMPENTENTLEQQESMTLLQGAEDTENVSSQQESVLLQEMEETEEDYAEALSSVSVTDKIAEINALAACSIVDVADLDSEAIHELFSAGEISEEIYGRIAGCSYRQNEQIFIEDLRYLRVLHMGFDGNVHVGELIVNKAVSEDILEIMEALYNAEYPIEKMVLVDEYGGDDEASMSDNNTSAFNYRTVAGTNKLSNHSFGTAIDINPLYNPYVKVRNDGSITVSPETGRQYADRTADFPYKIDRDGICYQLFTEHGFQWGGDWNSVKDYQHFEKSLE